MMEKATGICFKREVRRSDTAGAPRRFRVTQEMVKAMGQGAKLFFHLRCYSTSTNAEAVFSVWTGCFDKELPADAGVRVKLRQGATGNLDEVTVSTTEDTIFETEAAIDESVLMAGVELVVDVQASTGAAVESIEFEVWVTIVIS